MILRPMPGERAHDPSLEHVQREHELHRALEAARTLQARLELLGGHDEGVRYVRRLRDDLATHLGRRDYLHIDDTQNVSTIDDPGALKTFFKTKDDKPIVDARIDERSEDDLPLDDIHDAPDRDGSTL